MPAIPTPTVPWMTTAAGQIVGYDGGLPTLINTYISYGAFTFSAAIDFKFQVEPVYDSSGILPKYYKHTFTVETVLVPQMGPTADSTGTQPLDLNESQIRRNLSIPGLSLRIYAKGVGQNQRVADDPVGPLFAQPVAKDNQDPVIRGDGNGEGMDHGTLMFQVEPGMDLNFGPRPVVQILEPIGSSRVYRLIWSVDTFLPICCIAYQQLNDRPVFCLTPQSFTSNTKKDFTLTEFTYQVAWSVDELGYSMRTVSGTAEVAGRLFQDLLWASGNVSVDGPSYKVELIPDQKIKELITNAFPFIAGFNRSHSYEVSKQGNRLDWRIVDSEIKTEIPYYKHVMDCSAEMSLSNMDGAGFVEWEMSLSGTFTIFPGQPKYNAFLAFLTIVKSKLQTLFNVQGGGFQVLNQKGQLVNRSKTYLPMRHSYKEDIFGRTMTFEFTYMVVSDLIGHLADTRMFVPPTPANNWQEWKNSVPNYVKDGDGSFGFTLFDEKPLRGTCNAVPLEDPIETPKTYIDQNNESYYNYFNPQCPPENSNYLDFRNYFEIEERKNLIAHEPNAILPESYYKDQTQEFYQKYRMNYPPGSTPSQDSSSNAIVQDGQTKNLPTLQPLGTNRIIIKMKGYGVRVCGSVKPPTLISVKTAIGDIAPAQVYSNCQLDIPVSSYGSVKTVMSRWEIWYMIPVPLDANSNFIQSLTGEVDGAIFVSNGNFKSLDGNATGP